MHHSMVKSPSFYLHRFKVRFMASKTWCTTLWPAGEPSQLEINEHCGSTFLRFSRSRGPPRPRHSPRARPRRAECRGRAGPSAEAAPERSQWPGRDDHRGQSKFRGRSELIARPRGREVVVFFPAWRISKVSWLIHAQIRLQKLF